MFKPKSRLRATDPEQICVDDFFAGARRRIYSTSDVIGVEIGGALKNLGGSQPSGFFAFSLFWCLVVVSYADMAPKHFAWVGLLGGSQPSGSLAFYPCVWWCNPPKVKLPSPSPFSFLVCSLVVPRTRVRKPGAGLCSGFHFTH